MTKADVSITPTQSQGLSAPAPWNKGRAVGQMRPFTPAQVRLIKDLLANAERWRDLALFSVAIDTMLRASDLLALKVDDACEYMDLAAAEFPVRQKKTGRTVMVTLGDETRTNLGHWVRLMAQQGLAPQGLAPQGHHPLFPGTRRSQQKPITTDHLRCLVKEWAAMAQLNPKHYSSHSLRRTKATLIYAETGNAEAVRQLLGQHSIAATSAYLGITQRDALDIAHAIKL